MRSALVSLLAVVLLAAGCGGGDDSDSGSSESTSETASDTGSASPSESDEESSTSAPSTEDFCAGVREVLTPGGKDTEDAALELVQNGFPEDMPSDALDGVQVMVDLAPSLNDASKLFTAYTELSGTERHQVNALVGYVSTTCGKDVFDDVLPSLPDDLPSELGGALSPNS